jgi:hypothetical protein
VNLEAWLSQQLGMAVSTVRRRPYAYRTSFAIEELEVELGDGSILPLLLKHLDRCSLDEETRAAKPELVHDPEREIEAYRLLAGEELGRASRGGYAASTTTSPAHRRAPRRSFATTRRSTASGPSGRAHTSAQHSGLCSNTTTRWSSV